MRRSLLSGGHRFPLALGAVALIAASIPACAHVHQDDLEAELTQLRAEMREEIREGDEAVERRVSLRIDETESRVASLEADLAGLQDDFHTTVERLESAIRFNAPVHFAFDDATVRSEDREVLNRFAEVVRGYYGDAVLTVEGFTDSAGSPQYNQSLGERRAEAVKEVLVDAGLSPDRMRAVSYGEAQERQIVPGAQGPGEDGWQNRRVAIVVDFRPDDRPGVAAYRSIP